MIRNVSLNILIGLYTLVMCLWAFIVSLGDRSGGRRVHNLSAVPWARGVLRVSGVRLRVDGTEAIDWSVPHIYMANHQSAFDIFALLASLPTDFKFILKQELMKIPFLGLAMRRAGYIAIDRDDPRRAVKSVNSAAERIRGGASVLIFPEGTRSPDGRLGPFKKGGFQVALRSGCAIVPVIILNSRNIVGKGCLRIRPGEIVVKIMPPLSLAGLRKKDINGLMDRVRQAMVPVLDEAVQQ